ncbi:hypothetical protein FOQG_02175 [Fusarium oxysporum f. sp. raphani 54005]|nr:hypothetical protein FOVG_07222 [Fusarium oxysporum f. sp. pisi HDV247]EXK96749.1 hypothetical protein FOQG_02175 [Fusarium oxysporum f. sp. raphani 54005]EXL82639.1 hypothetical protein FOPG_04463 [Fusarium oxysporum f. sp. conglutinans race 2 54008]KAG6985018.1 hypothetical protein FocnCong_v004903 [Fusarium oxysporum f. sp. conglutinans]KAI8410621.1 hypothetical protein FOFC_10478 [Fusarium oxysporum]WKT40520.1 hypothetical protein QSH57_005326 [Fusarium oxysporum f. sp. vasinfectum]
MSFNNHRANVRGYPHAGGRGYIPPRIGRGRVRGQPQGFRNATPGPSYGQQRWEYEQPALYPQGYGRFPNNYPHYDGHYQRAPQQPPPPAVTWHPQPPYLESPGAAVNNAIHLSMNDNYPQSQGLPASQSQSGSDGQEAYPNQALVQVVRARAYSAE